MKHAILRSLLGAVLLAGATVAAGAEELTVNSILLAHRAGATADGIISVVNNPANAIYMTAGDLGTLRANGLAESVIAAIESRTAAPMTWPALVQPDDPRLVDVVRMIKSGISDPIIAEQLRQSGPAFHLSATDLIYLKQNGALEPIVSALMATNAATAATAAPAAPVDLAFDDLVLVKESFLKKSRSGRLLMRGDTFSWVDAGGETDRNFDFQITGLEKVWFTCQARTPENFCHQINFQIVKGDRYRFRAVDQDSGSNASVLGVMDALRLHFPQVAFGPPDA